MRRSQDELPIRVITPRIFRNPIFGHSDWRDLTSLFVLQTALAMTSAAALSIEEKLVLAQLVYAHGDADWTTITSAWTTHHAVKNRDVNEPQVSSRPS